MQNLNFIKTFCKMHPIPKPEAQSHEQPEIFEFIDFLWIHDPGNYESTPEARRLKPDARHPKPIAQRPSPIA